MSDQNLIIPMLQDGTEDIGQFVTRVLPLLREYNDYLNKFRAESRELNSFNPKKPREFEHDEHMMLQQRFERMRPVLVKLAHSVSQFIEHANMPPSIRLELELRLAEFEGNLEATDRISRRW